MMPHAYPTAEDFVAALAHPLDSDLGRKVVVPFGITWSDAIKLDRDLPLYYDIGVAEAVGLSLSYTDIGEVVQLENHQAGSGPFVMSSCAFWGHAKGCATYAGPLWKDLRFSDTPADAIAKLGAPSSIGRYDIHRWILPNFELTIHWNAPTQIRVVSYWLKQVG